MKFEIKNRWSGDVIFSLETSSFKLCVEAAIKKGADLSSADLSSANLSSADLSSADLSRADLSSADLSRADLYRADLSRADLSRANLSSADLSRADLSSADLSSADLSRANLYSADLSSADLSRADLSSADLSRANGANPNLCTPLRIMLDQVGKIRAYKLVNSNLEGPYHGGITYKKGEVVEAEGDTDESEQCSSGISLATLDWCMKEWRGGYRILVCEFIRKDIAAIPTATDGKFRVHRCKVVGEKDLVEIGLVEKESKE